MKQEVNKGLSHQEAEQLLHEFGLNSIEVPRKGFLLQLFMRQYKNLITLILFVAGVFSFYIGNAVDAFFIFSILIVNGIFGFSQEYKAEKTLEKLRDFTVLKSRVIRDGKEEEIETKYIVPADLVVLREGERVPADGTLKSFSPLELDESILSGESLPVEKKQGGTLFTGTFILRGRGTMKVEQTGLSTKFGEIAEKIEKIEKPKTPLEQNLSQLGKRLALVAIFASFSLIPLGLAQQRMLSEVILTSISLMVALIPEGLPLVLTIALAIGAYRMAKERTIVKKMTAIETLGATSLILTDKTGTLTQNKMSVKKHWLSHKDNFPLLLRAAVVGNAATLVLKENALPAGRQGEKFAVLGEKTDAALLLFAKDNVSNFDDFKNEGKIVRERPFDSILKTIEIDWEYKDDCYVFVRGAPESILPTIREKDKKAVEEKLLEFAHEGLRVIGFANKKKGEEAFTFLGLEGIYDPPREEAAASLREAHRAGIRVVMVTGDNPVTALAIAEEIGLIEQKEVVFTSDDLKKLSDEDLLRELPRVRVFARMNPVDKLRLVQLYRKAGFVVAVTGDGVNDALALAESNIGVAMGESGTDVAKEAADVVITDDNLATIIKAVEEGRNIYHNITRVIIYLLSSNAAEFLVLLVGMFFGLPIIFSPTQILWINLVTDGFPALALASDTKKRSLLGSKPRMKSEQIINRERFLTILKVSGFLTIVTILVYLYSLTRFSPQDARVVVFNFFVLLELLVVFFIRGGLFPLNKFLIISILVSSVLQVLIMVHPVLREIFS